MGRVVIVAYRPKPGKEEDLKALVRAHVPKLRALGLATERAALAMEAADGSIVEVFDAMEAAHADPEVQALWGEFAEACDYLPVAELPEAGQLFSEFEPLG